MPRTLVVTNDFPPRQGGIETFVYELVRRFPPDSVVVYTSSSPGSEERDGTMPFPVVRDRSRVLLPSPRVATRARALIDQYDCDRVWFGAAAPLGLLAGRLGLPSVATTHGHEVWWAALPGARQALRRIGRQVGTVTYLTPFTRDRLAAALGPQARLARLTPAVDSDHFHPHADGEAVRRVYRLGDRPVILTVSRLVPRKGQDSLIRALRQVRRVVPDATLLIVGSGPYEATLRRLARELPEDAVVFAGGHGHSAMPDFYAAADVFAMPCRTRRAGLEPEGLGIVFLEAAAAGLPVLAGDSGGAPDAVLDGRSGYVTRGKDTAEVAERLVELLTSPAGMGSVGRAWVQEEWSWETSYHQLQQLLQGAEVPAP
ncbi:MULTISPECIES: glycosyltransferase family 4 protein [unclassified Streptomyces]|uniref:glycosyltransferase family 4 protein n=1 Tax=unclassified Streptomyces TaxID=2593676 RepID=UPI001BE9A756|nr:MULTISPECIES: glycosyltransferase family 4 protein [unclassified Streptomyces]MBT2429503.1 glycosyltransferase family 4 protein [Streptomyces sp. ISL-112]MBT2461803.1 glycosyltransferase family 4 protein [Streptomyces sp. ISL-63]